MYGSATGCRTGRRHGSGSDEQWLLGYHRQTTVFNFTNRLSGRCVAAPAAGPGTVTVAFCDPLDPTQQWGVNSPPPRHSSRSIRWPTMRSADHLRHPPAE
ncbi:hypothetical protein GCM10010289_63400 [Streptomyces violascens]|uniref:Ricin B lectin domain-containing protein n=1 Tax=Streptomyces violascens TaxID=67381 RepID=A0ABQ3QSM2_9ACTN|nr:hypothetical protein GCM10010289_63400 [Streptomyces violascens]GHI40281.1 hypothetical protein Sviol_46890 [Streptomyces violascens]